MLTAPSVCRFSSKILRFESCTTLYTCSSWPCICLIIFSNFATRSLLLLRREGPLSTDRLLLLQLWADGESFLFLLGLILDITMIGPVQTCLTVVLGLTTLSSTSSASTSKRTL